MKSHRRDDHEWIGIVTAGPGPVHGRLRRIGLQGIIAGEHPLEAYGPCRLVVRRLSGPDAYGRLLFGNVFYRYNYIVQLLDRLCAANLNRSQYDQGILRRGRLSRREHGRAGYVRLGRRDEHRCVSRRRHLRLHERIDYTGRPVYRLRHLRLLRRRRKSRQPVRA